MADDKIAAVPMWSNSDLFDDRERAVLAYADALVLGGGRVPDGLMAKLKTFLSDEEILELTYITCLYDMHAVMTKALRLEFDDRDDPVSEVTAPKDSTAADSLESGGSAR